MGAVDVFWVGRLGDAVALRREAANQVFQAFWIISFIPSVVAPVVAKAAAERGAKELSKKIGEDLLRRGGGGDGHGVDVYDHEKRALASSASPRGV